MFSLSQQNHSMVFDFLTLTIFDKRNGEHVNMFAGPLNLSILSNNEVRFAVTDICRDTVWAKIFYFRLNNLIICEN